MTLQQALDNIAVYSALHNGVLDSSVKVLDKFIKACVDMEEELKALVDIEEKLGIDLITYFKIKDAKSVYVKESDGNISEMLVRPSENSIDVCHKGFAEIPECDKTLYFKDYGKTWAKTKEELEK